MKLEQHADVFTADDEKVGNLDRVVIDPRNNEVTHIVVSQGLLNKTRNLIPSSWVRRFEGDEVHLEANSKLLDELPEYQTS